MDILATVVVRIFVVSLVGRGGGRVFDFDFYKLARSRADESIFTYFFILLFFGSSYDTRYKYYVTVDCSSRHRRRTVSCHTTAIRKLNTIELVHTILHHHHKS